MVGEAVWWVGGCTLGGSPRSRVERITATGVTRGPSLPRDWHPAGVVAVAKRLWAVGGTCRPHEPVATVRVLETTDPDGQWAPGPRLPRPVRAPGVVGLPNGVLVAGGLGLGAAFGPAEWLRDAWFLDTEASDPRWRAVSRLPDLRAGGQLVAGPSGYAVLVGGHTPEGPVDRALLWEASDDRWHDVACGPEGLGARGIATLTDGTLVLVGGHRTVRDTSRRRFGPDHHPVVPRCHRVDVLAGTVIPLPDLSVPRRHASAIADATNAVWVVGGEVNAPGRHRFRVVADVERIDVDDWSGAEGEPLAEPRRSAGVARIGPRVFVVGGENDASLVGSVEQIVS